MNQAMSARLVNLGCGSRYHADWINIDIAAHGPGVIAHDLSKGIPLEENSCDAVYHSAVLEHIRLSGSMRCRSCASAGASSSRVALCANWACPTWNGSANCMSKNCGPFRVAKLTPRRITIGFYWRWRSDRARKKRWYDGGFSLSKAAAE